ncbi:secreted RxLR effector protein 161-like [Lathyrus oleraceus]|uniref:secreted RxLR effector protein 161-like n=1 Tax=Pisum sativum TaxID=3888 RepID=UPI0021CFF4A5|nr:secreted RxLR effector protein 161-like [Pisum sativum]
MQECNPTSIPTEPRLQLSNDTNEDDIDPAQYRRLIGSLRYICHTRPDLAYNIGMVNRFMHTPKVSHLAKTKRLIRYLKGTLDYGILFPKAGEGKECNLMGYTDSSWCSDVDDKKSTDGYLFMLGGASVAWGSRKEPIVALSLCEIEYIVSSLYACQETWIVNLIEDARP